MGQINPTLPVAGSTLNSIADPEIVTALQTIITLVNGNIDPTNLSLATGIMHLATRTVSSSTAANVGDLVLATSGTTITLPAPAPNALVGVQAQSTVTGASPVTVSGTSIYGVGFGPATSFLLGTGQSCAILQSDGSNWSIIGGQRDTGWLNITLTAGWTATSTYFVPATRVLGNMVALRGSATNNTGGSSLSIGAVNAAAKPASNLFLPPAVSNVIVDVSAMLINGASGAITLTGAVPNGTQIGLDGLTYSLG